MIVESVLTPTLHRNTMARVLFEALDAPSVLFAPSQLLATFPFGVSDALVIDVGYSEATVVPVNANFKLYFVLLMVGHKAILSIFQRLCARVLNF